MARRSPDSERPSDTDPLLARRRKLEALEARGVAAYPHAYHPSDTAADLLAAFLDDGPALRGRIAGRIASLRGHGRSTFLHLEDRTGRIQVYLKRDELGDAYDLVENVDLGDFLGVEGELFRTRTGEVTLRAKDVRLLAKALRGLPVGKEVEEEGGRRTWHRASDPEFRYRQRYADLAIRPEARAVFVERARIIRYLRDFLEAHRFLEVETPVLQPVYGGAAARPFETFHHALGVQMYLRIADELYLKRCIVGGIDRVYEISKDFRNEGIDRFHNPEFTMLEFYQAYADYHDFMALTEELIEGLVRRIKGGVELTYQGRTIDVRPPWPRLKFLDALEERGVRLDGLDRDGLAAEARRRGIEVAPADGTGRILDLLFARIVEPDLEGPVFVLDHPAELSPLAKRHREDPRLVERFEPYLFGREIGNAFTELNDPRDQRTRLEALAEAAARGDLEAPATVDEDFLRALEYGMPPTAGMGIGIDRLVMFLTDQASIRDVILFPMQRPEEGRAAARSEGAPREAVEPGATATPAGEEGE